MSLIRHHDRNFDQPIQPRCGCCGCRQVRPCDDGCDCSGDCENREDY